MLYEKECGNVFARWNGVDNLFLLPVLSLIGFVKKMFVYCRFILFDYYCCWVSSVECRVLNSIIIIIIMAVHDANGKYLLYDNKNVVVDM